MVSYNDYAPVVINDPWGLNPHTYIIVNNTRQMILIVDKAMFNPHSENQ